MKRIRSLLVWRGLTTQILLFAVMPITLVLILVTFGSVQLHRDAMRSLVGERDTRTVRSAAIALGAQISHRASIVQGLADRGQDNISPEMILSTSRPFTADFDIGVAFYQPNGCF